MYCGIVVVKNKHYWSITILPMQKNDITSTYKSTKHKLSPQITRFYTDYILYASIVTNQSKDFESINENKLTKIRKNFDLKNFEYPENAS